MLFSPNNEVFMSRRLFHYFLKILISQQAPCYHAIIPGLYCSKIPSVLASLQMKDNHVNHLSLFTILLSAKVP